MRTQRFHESKLGLSLCFAILFAAFFENFTQQVIAKSGREDRLEGNNLLIHVDSRWVGCRMGGYLPVRISLLNSAPQRTLRIRFEPGDEKNPVVEKKIRLPQNEKVYTTLAIPVVGNGQFGRIQFFEGNKLFDTLQSSFDLPTNDYQGLTQPACLVLSEKAVDLSAFRTSLRLYQRNAQAFPYRDTSEKLPELDILRLPPTMLPTSWIGYSGIDLVAMPAEVLSALESTMRQAILKWVQTGGTLILWETDKDASESLELNRLIFPEINEISKDWRPVELTFRGSDFLIRSTWPHQERFLQKHRDTMGNIFVFREDPFPGTISDWYPVMSQLDPAGIRWFERMGLSARESSGDFRKFLISGIKSVPVYAFLVLISLFTILIGPLNYFILWKKKKLFLLIVSIPSIAFATSLTLFGYSIFSNGLGVKTRVRSLTILDQRTQSAVTSSRNALYAGIPPSEGLVFSNDTAVFPIWSKFRQFDAGHVRWDDRQILDRGWIDSRTRTQFLTMTHRKERGRLEVEKQDGVLKVSNGFEFEILQIVISDDEGNLFGGTNFEAGAQTEFAEVDSSFLRGFQQIIDNNDYRKENRDLPSPQQNRIDSGLSRFDPEETQLRLSIPFSKNKAERLFRDTVNTMKENRRLPPKMYIAILKTNPGVEIGVEDATEIEGFHMLIGYY